MHPSVSKISKIFNSIPIVSHRFYASSFLVRTRFHVYYTSNKSLDGSDTFSATLFRNVTPSLPSINLWS